MALPSKGVQQRTRPLSTFRSLKTAFKSLELGSGRQLPEIYLPLDKEQLEIRLLLVKAGQGSDELHCELQQAFLTTDPVPSYYTISYCWGDAHKRDYLTLNGRRVDVPASSKVAIQRMRHPDRHCVLWIDALCINQNDAEEKGHQVGFMSQIYSNGQCNLIYLGEENGSSADAMKIIKHILEQMREETGNYKQWPAIAYSKTAQFLYSDTGIDLKMDLSPLFAFFAAPWFSRLWVAQEAALSTANTCYYGDSEITLGEVLAAAVWLTHKIYHLPFRWNEQPNIRNASQLFELADTKFRAFVNEMNLSTSLSYISFRLRDFNVLDPRDRVYAILGLHAKFSGKRDMAISIPPDYSNPLRHVLRDAARFTIREAGALDVFQFIDQYGLDETADKSWPSWVPHWQVRHDVQEARGVLSGRFAAGGAITLDVETALGDADPDHLQLSGYLFDPVSDVLPIVMWNTWLNATKMLRYIEDARHLCSTAAIAEDSNDIGATLIADTDHHRQRAAESFYAYLKDWTSFRRDEGRLPRPSDAADNYSVWAYHLALNSALFNRRFFTTPSGYMGIGPRTMQAHDIIAVLYGCMWPVVLYQKENHYRIRGVCYVHGIMDGEVVRKFKAEERPEDIIILG